MSDTSINNKRIAKNTLLLYFRMFFMMAITLYTSRVVLAALGVEDFGIYNVVGGVVAMMGILNGAMSVSTQRFLTFELGKNDKIRLKQVFSISMSIYILFAIILLLLAETIGLWFLNTYLVIPSEKMEAANWVYQFSIISAVITLLYNPYNAMIVAHERMKIYAYVSVYEAILKLTVALLIQFLADDRLFYYGLFLLIASFMVTLTYFIYSVRSFEEARYTFYWEKELFNQLLSYSGWNMFGSIASLVKGQGLNILLNLFFNPSVNAARGIAFQINSAVSQFFTNFYTAVRPQITKYYAQDDIENMTKLVFRSSKFSFFLIMFISLPLIVEAPFVIKLWLGQIPEYVIPFMRLIILITAVDAMATPLMTTAHATGNIKLYQSVVGTLVMFNIPISYVALELGYSAVSVFYISLVISIISLFLRLWIVNRLLDFPVIDYMKDVFGRCTLCSLLGAIIPVLLASRLGTTFLSFCLVSIVSLFSSGLTIWFIGLNATERSQLLTIVKKKIKR